MHWLYVSIDAPSEQADASGGFWSDALGWELGQPWRDHPEFRSLVPPDGDAYAHVQRTDGDAPAVHVDLGSADVGADVRRLTELGATSRQDRGDWHVMASPGGLPFCVVPGSGETRPEPTTWPDGHRTRLVQICIDSPAALHDREVEFWRAAMPWEFRPSDGPEFAGKLYPPAPGPVQLLLQRLGPDDGGSGVRCHIDLGTDDIDAETTRLESLGAVPGLRTEGFQVLTDPTGMVFCATANPPG